jgi:hypothetical protein
MRDGRAHDLVGILAESWMFCHVRDTWWLQRFLPKFAVSTATEGRYTSSDRMNNFAIVPSHRSYWIYEGRGAGTRRTLGCFSCEDEAVKRLRRLQATEDTREQRRIAQEASRFSHSSARARA